MLTISLPAVHAWAQTIAAVGSVIAVVLLVLDRFRRPLQISGYLTLEERTRRLGRLFSEEGVSYQRTITATVYLFSEVGERLLLASIAPSPHFEIALIPKGDSSAAFGEAPLEALTYEWTSKRLHIRAVAERGHSGNEPMAKLAVRLTKPRGPWRRFLCWALVPTLVTRGVLPYRVKGRFRRRVTLADENLLKAVRRLQQDSSRR